MLGEGSTCAINGSVESPEKKFSINFSWANAKFCLSFHYNADNSYSNNKNANFSIQFCFGSISNRIGALECIEVTLNGNMYGF